MIANPLVKFLEKKVKILRKHSSAIIIIAVIVAIVVVANFIITKLVKEAAELINELPAITEQMNEQFDKISERVLDISKSLPSNVQGILENFLMSIENYFDNLVNSDKLPTISSASTFAKNIAEGFLFIIVTILSAYFFTANREDIINGFKKLLPISVSEGWNIIFDNFKSAVGGYFRAQFKIMLLLVVVMFGGFVILGIEYSFLLALGIAFLDFLPVFGTGAILWPWALSDFIAGDYMRAVGLMVIYLICQILKQVLQPKMVGDSIGLSPLATLFFMYIGYRLYGIMGIILGVPVGMVLVNLYRSGMFDRIIKGFKIIVHDINEFRKF